ncbi:MAG: DinB family protein [Saprospiraceae bacterium]|nr:DinB family protein [Saprospiraceae bacterium]
MKSFFQPEAQAELLARLEKLTPNTAPQWGKMNAAQMLGHCAVAYKSATGELVLKPMPFIFRLLGRMIKKSVLSEKPYKKNSPTAPEFLIPSDVDFEHEKQRFKEDFEKLAVGPQVVRTLKHPFFGEMSAEEWGIHLFKHTDYHFAQFGI